MRAAEARPIAGRGVAARPDVNEAACDGCGLCAAACAPDALRRSSDEQGLSLGVQLTAAKGREDLLLHLTQQMEECSVFS